MTINGYVNGQLLAFSRALVLALHTLSKRALSEISSNSGMSSPATAIK